MKYKYKYVILLPATFFLLFLFLPQVANADMYHYCGKSGDKVTICVSGNYPSLDKARSASNFMDCGEPETGDCPKQAVGVSASAAKWHCCDPCENVSEMDEGAARSTCTTKGETEAGKKGCISNFGPGACPVSGTAPEGNPSGLSADKLLENATSLNQTKISGANSIPSLINRLISFLLYPLGAFALALYVWAGFTWMTSAGNAERTAKALKIVLWTSLGVMVTLSSYVLVQFLFSQIK